MLTTKGFESRLARLERLRFRPPADPRPDGIGLAALLAESRRLEALRQPEERTRRAAEALANATSPEELEWLRAHAAAVDQAIPWRPFDSLADMVVFCRQRLAWARANMGNKREG
jgi:hypothetical protein